MRGDVPKKHREFARVMRADPTRPEELLWQVLRGRRMAACKFRRQVPLKGYILDFVCFEAWLIIEADGWQHSDSRADAVRDALFHADGFHILRFRNDEVLDDLDGVCRIISDALKRPLK